MLAAAVVAMAPQVGVGTLVGATAISVLMVLGRSTKRTGKNKQLHLAAPAEFTLHLLVAALVQKHIQNRFTTQIQTAASANQGLIWRACEIDFFLTICLLPVVHLSRW